MHRKLSKFAFFVITVLSSALVSRYVFKFGIESSDKLSKLLRVAIGMAIIILSFIPLSYFNKPIQNATKKYLETSKKIAEKKNGGVIWGLVLALVILFFLYAFLWYDLTPANILSTEVAE